MNNFAAGGTARRWMQRAVGAAGLMPTDDWPLWHRACAGDAACARALVQQLTPTAFGLALQLLRRREDAQDAVQEAFVRLWRSRPSDTQGARLATYFNTIVINRCRSMLVAALRETATDPQDLDAMREAAPAEDGPDDSATGLDAAIAVLPVRQRMAVVMWAWGDADMADIARQLEIEPNAAHQLLHRAKQSLRRHLEGGNKK